MAVRSSSLLAGTVPDPVSRIRCLGDRWWVQEQTESQGVLNQGGGLVRKWRGLLENRGLIPAEIKYFRGGPVANLSSLLASKKKMVLEVVGEFLQKRLVMRALNPNWGGVGV